MKSVSIKKEEHLITSYRQIAGFLEARELDEINNALRLEASVALRTTEKDLSKVTGSLAMILSGRVGPGEMSQDAARDLATRDFVQACKGKDGILGGVAAAREFLSIGPKKPKKRHIEALLEAYWGQMQNITLRLERKLDEPIQKIIKARPVGAFEETKRPKDNNRESIKLS